jgi:hypothetical protein
MISETSIDVLKSRVAKGLVYCNDIIQQSKLVADNDQEYKALMAKLDKHTITLVELNEMLNLQGFSECAYGQCQSSDQFICQVCSKRGSI